MIAVTTWSENADTQESLKISWSFRVIFKVVYELMSHWQGYDFVADWEVFCREARFHGGELPWPPIWIGLLKITSQYKSGWGEIAKRGAVLEVEPWIRGSKPSVLHTKPPLMHNTEWISVLRFRFMESSFTVRMKWKLLGTNLVIIGYFKYKLLLAHSSDSTD